MRRLATFRKPTEVKNDYGEVTLKWDPPAQKFKAWVAITPRGGREFFSAEAVQADVTHMIEMRYNGSVTPKWRIDVDGRTIQIRSMINENERNHKMILMGTEQLS